MNTPGGYPARAARLLDAPDAIRAEILSLVSDRLDAVEVMFRNNLRSPLELIEEIGDFVAEGAGKRVRPTLHLLTSRLCGYDGPHDVLLATVLEFIHSATLIHDDIIDEARTRRGRPSLNHHWGNNVSVLFGDYLFAKAMDLALRADSLVVMQRLADVTLRMTEGEMLQTRYAGRLDLTEAEHLDLIQRKTAELFGACCELAGVLAGADPSRLAALGRYGRHVGMAFQIVDDLLDFTGDPRRLGKPGASDLREGKVTLALIDLLSSGSVEGRELAASILQNGRDGAPEIAQLTGLLADSGALERTRRRAQGYAESAAAELACFEDSPARSALLAVPELLIFRDR